MRTTSLNQTIAEWQAVRSSRHDAPSRLVFDYLSVDCEGKELSVLRGFPFRQYGVRVLTVESSAKIQQPLRQLLKTHNLVHVGKLDADEVWVQRALAQRARRLLKPPGTADATRAMWRRTRGLYVTLEQLAKAVLRIPG